MTHTNYNTGEPCTCEAPTPDPVDVAMQQKMDEDEDRYYGSTPDNQEEAR